MQVLGQQGHHTSSTLGARPAGPEAAADAPETPLLVVEVAGVRCALPAEAVVELHQMVATVALPTAVTGVDGVIDRRGSLVAVLDLRARLGLPTRPPRASDHLVVVHLALGPVALRVDRIHDLVVLPADDVVTAAALAGEAGVVGAARLPDGLLLVHDVESFLSPEDAAAVAAGVRQLLVADGAVT